MNAVQENKSSMYFKIDAFFSINLPVLSLTIPILADKIAQFTDLLNSLGEYDMEATEDITGYALQKQSVRSEITEYALAISGGLAAFATDQGDFALTKKCNLTRTELDISRDTHFLWLSDRVLTLANPFTAALPPYNVTAAKISSLSNLLGTLRQIIEFPGDQRSEGSSFGSKVDKTMAEMDILLLSIDRLMATIAMTHDVLYMQYKLDRLIDDNATGGGTPPNFIGTILPNSFQNVLTLPYIMGRSFKVKNKSNDFLNWGLSTLDTEFTNTPHISDPNSISTKVSTTLGPDGDILLFQNTTANPVDIEVTVFE